MEFGIIACNPMKGSKEVILTHPLSWANVLDVVQEAIEHSGLEIDPCGWLPPTWDDLVEGRSSGLYDGAKCRQLADAIDEYVAAIEVGIVPAPSFSSDYFFGRDSHTPPSEPKSLTVINLPVDKQEHINSAITEADLQRIARELGKPRDQLIIETSYAGSPLPYGVIIEGHWYRRMWSGVPSVREPARIATPLTPRELLRLDAVREFSKFLRSCNGFYL